MKSFEDYIKFRENMEPVNADDTQDMSRLYKIIRLAWKEHPSETNEFIRRLSTMNPEIGAEAEGLSGKDHELKPKKPTREKDVLYSPDADSGSLDSSVEDGN